MHSDMIMLTWGLSGSPEMESFKKLEMIGHYSFIFTPNLWWEPVWAAPIYLVNFLVHIWEIWMCFQAFSQNHCQMTSCSSSDSPTCLSDPADPIDSGSHAGTWIGRSSNITVRWCSSGMIPSRSLPTRKPPGYLAHFSEVCFPLTLFQLSLIWVGLICCGCFRYFRSTSANLAWFSGCAGSSFFDHCSSTQGLVSYNNGLSGSLDIISYFNSNQFQKILFKR